MFVWEGCVNVWGPVASRAQAGPSPRSAMTPTPTNSWKRAIQAILWDNDGVLVNTESIHFAVTRQVLAGAGLTLTKEQYVDLYLVRGRSAWDLASEHGIRP